MNEKRQQQQNSFQLHQSDIICYGFQLKEEKKMDKRQSDTSALHT